MYTHLKLELGRFASDVIRKYRELLQRDDRKASGNLINNITPKIEVGDDQISVILELEDYWEEVELGRKPTKNNGSGELRQKIEEWISLKGIQPYPTSNGKLPTIPQLAFLISRKIHKEGYVGGDKQNGDGYLAEALKEIIPQYEVRFTEALTKDAEDEVKKMFEKSGINNFKPI